MLVDVIEGVGLEGRSRTVFSLKGNVSLTIAFKGQGEIGFLGICMYIVTARHGLDTKYCR